MTFLHPFRVSLERDAVVPVVNGVKIPHDAAQPPIVMVVMMMDIHPVGVVLRLAGLLCNTGKWAITSCPSVSETIALSIRCASTFYNMVFFGPAGTHLCKLHILDLQ